MDSSHVSIAFACQSSWLSCGFKRPTVQSCGRLSIGRAGITRLSSLPCEARACLARGPRRRHDLRKHWHGVSFAAATRKTWPGGKDSVHAQSSAKASGEEKTAEDPDLLMLRGAQPDSGLLESVLSNENASNDRDQQKAGNDASAGSSLLTTANGNELPSQSPSTHGVLGVHTPLVAMQAWAPRPASSGWEAFLGGGRSALRSTDAAFVNVVPSPPSSSVAVPAVIVGPSALQVPATATQGRVPLAAGAQTGPSVAAVGGVDPAVASQSIAAGDPPSPNDQGPPWDSADRAALSTLPSPHSSTTLSSSARISSPPPSSTPLGSSPSSPAALPPLAPPPPPPATGAHDPGPLAALEAAAVACARASAATEQVAASARDALAALRVSLGTLEAMAGAVLRAREEGGAPRPVPAAAPVPGADDSGADAARTQELIAAIHRLSDVVEVMITRGRDLSGEGDGLDADAHPQQAVPGLRSNRAVVTSASAVAAPGPSPVVAGQGKAGPVPTRWGQPGASPAKSTDDDDGDVRRVMGGDRRGTPLEERSSFGMPRGYSGTSSASPLPDHLAVPQGDTWRTGVSTAATPSPAIFSFTTGAATAEAREGASAASPPPMVDVTRLAAARKGASGSTGPSPAKKPSAGFPSLEPIPASYYYGQGGGGPTGEAGPATAAASSSHGAKGVGDTRATRDGPGDMLPALQEVGFNGLSPTSLWSTSSSRPRVGGDGEQAERVGGDATHGQASQPPASQGADGSSEWPSISVPYAVSHEVVVMTGEELMSSPLAGRDATDARLQVYLRDSVRRWGPGGHDGLVASNRAYVDSASAGTLTAGAAEARPGVSGNRGEDIGGGATDASTRGSTEWSPGVTGREAAPARPDQSTTRPAEGAQEPLRPPAFWWEENKRLNDPSVRVGEPPKRGVVALPEWQQPASAGGREAPRFWWHDKDQALREAEPKGRGAKSGLRNTSSLGTNF